MTSGTLGRIATRHAERGRAAARLTAWVLWGVMLVLVVGGLLVWIATGQPVLAISFVRGTPGTLAVAATALVFTTIGTVLAARLTTNPIGWLLMVVGLLFAVLTPVNLLIERAFEVARPFPAATIFIAWLMSSAMTPTIAVSMTTLCLVFPDGRLPSGRWSLGFPLAVVGAFLLVIASALEPTGLIWYPALPNPFAAASDLAPVVGALRLFALLVLLAAGLIAAGAVAHRYRQASAAVRRQLRWILVGVASMTAGLLPFLVARYALAMGDEAGEVFIVLAAAAICMFPITVVLAVIRRHLFDIDRVISKTLVYVPLMGILAGVYTASLTLFQRIFVSLTDSTSDASMVLSALLLASVFAPVRSALEGQVARRFRPAEEDRPSGARTGSDVASLGEPMPAAGSASRTATTRPPAPRRTTRARTATRKAAPPPATSPTDLAARVAELEEALRELRGREGR